MQGRTFDFGMTAARNNPVSAALGSGIPCGVAARAGTGPLPCSQIPLLLFWCALPAIKLSIQRITPVCHGAGADIDALGFVFLGNVTSSVLTGVTYEGISTTQVLFPWAAFLRCSLLSEVPPSAEVLEASGYCGQQYCKQYACG